MEVINNKLSHSRPVGFNESRYVDTQTVLLRISKRNEMRYGPGLGMNFFEILSDNYLSARTHLIRILENNQQIPDIIIIDLAFNKREVKNFVEWLNKSAEFKGIPVIYNMSQLNPAESKELQLTGYIDDIVDIDKNFNVLPAKSVFLKKVKALATVPTAKPAGIPVKKNTFRSTLEFGIRRSLDILISGSLILLLLPVFILIALVIRIESRGSVFYISHRAGRGYKIFNFYKFRTMHVGSDSKREELEKLNLYSLQNTSAQFFKIKDDPRVTKVGSFLRNTSLDELPQLINVLKGDMSIVGNRPLPLYEAATLTTNEWAERFMAPAGITGLWQIKKRGNENMSVEERISLDITYAQNNDLLKDLWILAQTPSALFQKINV
jgi:lipopolysaccharide/colanic/teichoic acid biosynthesis glycosyltransferase